MLTAAEILRSDHPSLIFSGDPDTIRSEYNGYAKVWHPDRNKSPEASKVMAHINQLYKRGLELLSANAWDVPGLLKLIDINKKVHTLKYRISHSFELGTMYISDNVVLYLVSNVHRPLFENAKKVISGFRYADKKMEAEISRYLPKILDTFETDDQLALVVGKTPDLLLLRDVLQYYDKMPDRHVAWILSRLYNLACYLDYAKLGHNGILLDTYFVSPEYHSGALLGGWWYTLPQGSRMLSAPVQIFNLMMPKVKASKMSAISTDLESINFIGRALLGDPNGTRLQELKAAPEPLISWLRGITPGDAITTYTRWQQVLADAYGPRKFVPMDLDANKLYKK